MTSDRAARLVTTVERLLSYTKQLEILVYDLSEQNQDHPTVAQAKAALADFKKES